MSTRTHTAYLIVLACIWLQTESIEVHAAEITEANASSWAGFADDNASFVITDSSEQVKLGDYSIKFETESGYRTGLQYPASGDAQWNLSAATSLEFWIYAENNSVYGFQGNQPIVHLISADGSYSYEPQSVLMFNNAWHKYTIPLAGDNTWTRTQSGSPDLTAINQIQLDTDTWDFGFTLYLDGLIFPDSEETPLLDAPTLSFSTSDNRITISWTQVSNATGYTLFYSPYPSADPVGSLDMGSALSASGELPYGSSYYLSVQAYNEAGGGEFSNIEQFTLKFADIVQFEDSWSDIDSIIYGDQGEDLVIFNDGDGTQSVAMTYADGASAIFEFDQDGRIETIDLDGYRFSYVYFFGVQQRQITFTKPDGTETVFAEFAETQNLLSCRNAVACTSQAKTSSYKQTNTNTLEDNLNDIENMLPNAFNDLRKWAKKCNDNLIDCAGLGGLWESAAEAGRYLIDIIKNRESRNYKRFPTYVSCGQLLSTTRCTKALTDDGPAVWPEYEYWLNRNPSSGGGLIVGDNGVEADETLKDQIDPNRSNGGPDPELTQAMLLQLSSFLDQFNIYKFNDMISLGYKSTFEDRAYSHEFGVEIVQREKNTAGYFSRSTVLGYSYDGYMELGARPESYPTDNPTIWHEMIHAVNDTAFDPFNLSVEHITDETEWEHPQIYWSAHIIKVALRGRLVAFETFADDVMEKKLSLDAPSGFGKSNQEWARSLWEKFENDLDPKIFTYNGHSVDDSHRREMRRLIGFDVRATPIKNNYLAAYQYPIEFFEEPIVNTPPEAKILVGNDRGVAGTTYYVNERFTLDGNSSSDLEGEIASWSWAMSNGSSVLPQTRRYFSSPGSKEITLTVTDSEGLSNTATVILTILEGLCDPANCIPDLEGYWERNGSSSSILRITQAGSSLGAEWIAANGAACFPDDFLLGKSSFIGSVTGASNSDFWYSTWACSLEETRSKHTFTIALEAGEYVLRINGHTYRKTVYVESSENNPPVAIVAVTNSSGANSTTFDVNETFILDASGSYDRETTIASYAWKTGDTTSSRAPFFSNARFTGTYSSPGVMTLTLTVTDTDGASSSTTFTLTIQDVGGSGNGNSGVSSYGQASVDYDFSAETPESIRNCIGYADRLGGVNNNWYEGCYNSAGQRTGVWKFFNGGELQFSSTWRNGLMHGLYNGNHPNFQYYSGGTVGYFVNDKREGLWEYWNREGQLYCVLRHENGDAIGGCIGGQ